MHHVLRHSSVPAPAHSKPTERTPAGKAGGEDEKRGKNVDPPDVRPVLPFIH